MNRFTEVRTVDTSPLTLQLPKELLKVPVRITVEPAPTSSRRRVKPCFAEFAERPVRIARFKKFSKDELHER